MAERVSRDKLKNALRGAGVDFPQYATTAQLKRLYHQVGFEDMCGADDTTSAGRLAKCCDELRNTDAKTQITGADAVTNTTVGAYTNVGDIDVVANSTAYAAAAADPAAVANFAAETNVADIGAVANSVVAADPAAVFNSAAAAVAAVNMNNVDTAIGMGNAAAIVGSQGVDVNCNYDDDAVLEHELQKLKKKREILELQRQIQKLEGTVFSRIERKVDFSDVEHAIPKFSGDNPSHSVEQFIRNFEDIMQTINADERFKLLSLRRSLSGTARVFLARTSAISYGDLKKEIIEEFGIIMTRQDVYTMMAQRRWNKKEESLHCYILNMQSIAKRSDISEIELIDFIINGIDNISNVNLLLGARSLEELKMLINRYQQKSLQPHGRTQSPVQLNKPRR